MASIRHTEQRLCRESVFDGGLALKDSILPMTWETRFAPHHRFQAVTSVAVARSHRKATNGGAVCNGVGGRKSLGSVPSIHQHGSLPHESCCQ